MSAELTKKQEAQPETVSQERWFKPACDVFENENEWMITADLPGVGREALSVHLDRNDLTIEGRREPQDGRQEFVGYRRSFTVPTGVDGEKVNAEMNLGVVVVHLPKAEAIKPRQIAVTAG